MTNPTKPRSRHGLNRVLAAVKLKGLDGIDRRTSAARALLRWREKLIADLGGIETISSQRLILVDVATRTKALLDHVDEWLLSQRSVVNRRARALLPVVAQRQALADSLARALGQLGLERVEPPGQPLTEFVERVKPFDSEDAEP
jgi:hypothetical protein